MNDRELGARLRARERERTRALEHTPPSSPWRRELERLLQRVREKLEHLTEAGGVLDEDE